MSVLRKVPLGFYQPPRHLILPLSQLFYVPRKAEITKCSFELRRHFLSAVVDVYSEFLDFYIRHDVEFRKRVGVKRLNSPDQTKTDSMVVLNFVCNSATFLKFRSQNSRNLEHWLAQVHVSLKK